MNSTLMQMKINVLANDLDLDLNLDTTSPQQLTHDLLSSSLPLSVIQAVFFETAY